MQSTPERGGCLTILLVLMIIGTALSAINYFLSPGTVMQMFPGMPSWGSTVLAIVYIVALVGAIGMWMWKRWGFYAYVAAVVAQVVILALAGQLIAGVIGAAIGLAIVWFVIKDKWAAFA